MGAGFQCRRAVGRSEMSFTALDMGPEEQGEIVGHYGFKDYDSRLAPASQDAVPSFSVVPTGTKFCYLTAEPLLRCGLLSDHPIGLRSMLCGKLSQLCNDFRLKNAAVS